MLNKNHHKSYSKITPKQTSDLKSF